MYVSTVFKMVRNVFRYDFYMIKIKKLQSMALKAKSIRKGFISAEQSRELVHDSILTIFLIKKSINFCFFSAKWSYEPE